MTRGKKVNGRSGTWPVRRDRGVDGLTAPDDVQHAVQDRRVPFGALSGIDRGLQPQERVAGGDLSAGLQQPGQRLAGDAWPRSRAPNKAVNSAAGPVTT
jgi:hypothetical protein